jgi:hypothetical protein
MSNEKRAENLSAYALGEMKPDERTRFEKEMTEAEKRDAAEIAELTAGVSRDFKNEPELSLDPARRAKILTEAARGDVRWWRFLPLGAAVAALTAIFLVPPFLSQREESTRGRIAQLVTALEKYHTVKGRYPTTKEGIPALAELAKPRERHLLVGDLPLADQDSWGHVFRYVSKDAGMTFVLCSDGPDGIPETMDDICT